MFSKALERLVVHQVRITTVFTTAGRKSHVTVTWACFL